MRYSPQLNASKAFFFVFIDETCNEFGIDDVASVALILSGQNWFPTRAKPAGATKGTSIASKLSRKYLDIDLQRRVLPTLANASVKQLKIFWVKNIGKFVGRAVPVVGWVIAAHNITMISIKSVAHYNGLVKAEDRIF